MQSGKRVFLRNKAVVYLLMLLFVVAGFSGALVVKMGEDTDNRVWGFRGDLYIRNSNNESRLYNATGSGLQEAINEMGDATGGKVWLPNATLTIDATIDLNSTYYLTIEGLGVSSVIKLDANINDDVFNGSTVNSLTLRNLKIDGNKANNPNGESGIELNNVVYVLLDNVEITGCNEDALYIHRDGVGGDAASFISCVNSKFKSSRNGTRIVEVGNVNFFSCDFGHNDYGLWITGGHRIGVYNCWFESNGQNIYGRQGTLGMGLDTDINELLIANSVMYPPQESAYDIDLDYVEGLTFINIHEWNSSNIGANCVNVSSISSKFRTRNGGANASTVDGGTIAHGLSATPTYVICTPSVAGEMVSVTAIGATTFTVAIKDHAGNAGTSQTIYWEAVYNP